MAGQWHNFRMRQLQLFTTAQLATMRDRTARRNYSPANEEFRREHERHRAWGLTQRHAEKLRRIRAASHGRRPPASEKGPAESTRPSGPSRPPEASRVIRAQPPAPGTPRASSSQVLTRPAGHAGAQTSEQQHNEQPDPPEAAHPVQPHHVGMPPTGRNSPGATKPHRAVNRNGKSRAGSATKHRRGRPPTAPPVELRVRQHRATGLILSQSPVIPQSETIAVHRSEQMVTARKIGREKTGAARSRPP
jgi:hypothetical protein